MTTTTLPRRSSPRAQLVMVERQDLVGRLIDCQILAAYAADAIGAASCPENAAPVSVARGILGQLETLLKDEAGRIDRMVAVSRVDSIACPDGQEAPGHGRAA